MAYVKGQFDVTQNVDANGDPATSYILKFFIWDTATPATVYSDSSGTSLGTTVTLNSLGQPQTSGGTACDIFFDTAVVYKAQLYLSDGATTVGTSIGPFYPLGLNASQTVDSFAAAYGSAFTGINAVTTRSFYGSWSGTTAGPKGGATYHRDGTTGTVSTAYADNSGFYDVNGDGFRLSRSQELNVNMFGANGSTDDDSTAFNNAVSFMSEANGGTCYLLDMTYKVNATVTLSSGIYFKGRGRRSSHVQSHITDGSPLFYTAKSSPDTAGATHYKYGVSDMTIVGYGSDAAGAGCGPGVKFEDGNNWFVNNCTITNFPDTSATQVVAAAFDCEMVFTDITNSLICLDVTGGSGSPNAITHIFFHRCSFSGAVRQAVSLYRGGSVIFQGCTIQDVDDGADATAAYGLGVYIQYWDHAIFDGCWFERTTKNSAYVGTSCEHIIFKNCRWSSAGYTGGAVGTEDASYPTILVTGSAHATQIEGGFFLARNGNDITINSGAKDTSVWLPRKDDDGSWSITNNGTNSMIVRQTEAGSRDGYIFSNAISVNALFAENTLYPINIAGDNGHRYQIYVDSSNNFKLREESGAGELTIGTAPT